MSKHEEIKKVAYEIFEKSGKPHGSDLDHWFEAERIVHERSKEAAAPAEAGQLPADISAPAEEKKAVRTRRKTAAEAKPTAPKKTKAKTAAKTTRRKKTE